MTLLHGLKVVEMASVITGPSAGALLADLGADVVKVEPPGGGDPFRSWEASGARVRASFAAFNRGKRSLVLDVKTAEGRAVYLELVSGADVVIENYRPGRMARLGIGWEAVHETSPKTVYCHITGRGSTGPDADQPTYDAVAQALSGLWSQFTDLGDPQPVGPPMSDQLTSLYAVAAVLAAVHSARETGRGELVEVDMLAASLAFSAQGVASTTWTGTVPTKASRARSSQSYAFVAEDGLPFAVHLSTPHKFWVALCETVGRTELIEDPRFVTKAERIQHYDELKAELSAIFDKRPRAEWLAALIAADVPAAPILTVAEAIESPQVRAKRLIDVDGEGTSRGLVRSPVVHHGSHLRAELPPPALGEHTDCVLAELGRADEEIDRLRAAGVVQ